MIETGAASGASCQGSITSIHSSQRIAPGTSPVPTPTSATPSGTRPSSAGQRSAWSTSTFAPLSASTWAISSPRQCQLIGTALAPSGTVAIEACRNSSELRSRSATRSPAVDAQRGQSAARAQRRAEQLEIARLAAAAAHADL